MEQRWGVLTRWHEEPITELRIDFIEGTFMGETERNPQVLV